MQGIRESNMNILWVSPMPAYDAVPHAGGKTWNFYLKRFAAEKDVRVRALVFSKAEEANKIDWDKNIQYDVLLSKGSFWLNLRRVVTDIVGSTLHGKSFCPYYKRRLLQKALARLANSGYQPDVIITEWTEMVVLIDLYRRYFPNAKTVASEHDVSFVGLERKLQAASKSFGRARRMAAFHRMANEELDALKRYDIIAPQSDMDVQRLIQKGLDERKIHCLAPYIQNMGKIWEGNKKQLLFYGAMYRPENYLSAMWFIENVLPSLNGKDISFCALGNNPPSALVEQASEKVRVPGYADDVSVYFRDSYCFVAPLVLGAGIKVKVLEAMSSGIPLIANGIAMEGINAVAGRDYLHAETAKEFEDAIEMLLKHPERAQEIGACGRKFFEANFDCEVSYQRYRARLMKETGF